MIIPIVVVVFAAVALNQGSEKESCEAQIQELSSGVVTTGDNVVSVVSELGEVKSWVMDGVAQAFTNGGDGVVASNGSELIHFLGEGSVKLHNESHVLIGVGDDTNGQWWAFTIVDPSLFGEQDDGSTILAAFSLDGDSKKQIGWASGPEFGITHLSVVKGRVVITSAEDLGERIKVGTFDGVKILENLEYVSEPVAYNSAPFLLASIFIDDNTFALLEAPEETENSTTTDWSVRFINALSGEVESSTVIGKGEQSDAFTALVLSDEGVVVTGPTGAWLVKRDGVAKPIKSECQIGGISDLMGK
jgi:hypothetical protein